MNSIEYHDSSISHVNIGQVTFRCRRHSVINYAGMKRNIITITPRHAYSRPLAAIGHPSEYYYATALVTPVDFTPTACSSSIYISHVGPKPLATCHYVTTVYASRHYRYLRLSHNNEYSIPRHCHWLIVTIIYPPRLRHIYVTPISHVGISSSPLLRHINTIALLCLIRPSPVVVYVIEFIVFTPRRQLSVFTSLFVY